MLAVRSTDVDTGGAVSIAVTGAGGAAAAVTAGVSVGVWATLPAASTLLVVTGVAAEDEVGLPAEVTVGASGSAAVVTVWVGSAGVALPVAPDVT
jgi:hypothetical protein